MSLVCHLSTDRCLEDVSCDATLTYLELLVEFLDELFALLLFLDQALLLSLKEFLVAPLSIFEPLVRATATTPQINCLT